MSEYTWPHAELAAPDLEQPDDARIAVHTSPALPAYSPFWPYTELENRRDSRVYDLLQKQKAITEKIREENKQIAAERANIDKHKARSKAHSPDRVKGPRICKNCGEHTWEQMPLGACDACSMRAALQKSFRANWEAPESTKEKTVKSDQHNIQPATGYSHGQPPLISSWVPQRTEASSSWQVPPPPPPPRPTSSSQQVQQPEHPRKR